MLTLKLPATVAALERVNSLVRSLAAEGGLSPKEAYQLRLATEELFVNIVKHGYGTSQPDGVITIEGGVSEHSVWIRLIDTAPPFDPFKVPHPTGLDRPLQDRAPGALGLYLAQDAVDAASYEYVDGANRTTVVMRRSGADDGPTDRARTSGDGQTGDGQTDDARQRTNSKRV